MRDPYFFRTDDNCDHFLPWYVLNYRTLVDDGTLALINWHQYCGQPHLGHGMQGTLYPPNYVACFIALDLLEDPLAIIEILVLFHGLIGALFFYALFRSQGCSPAICLLGSLAALTTPFVVLVSKIWVSISVLAAWFPALLILILRFGRQASGRDLAFYGLAKAMLLLHGNEQWVVFSGIFELLLLLGARLADPQFSPWKALGRAAAGNTLALALALPVVFEMFWASAASPRAESFVGGKSVEMSLNAGQFWRAQFGWFAPEVMSFHSTISFVGVWLALGVAAWTSRRSFARDAAVFLGLALIALLFALSWVPVLSLPGLNFFRWPMKWTVFFGLFAVIGTTLLVARAIERGMLRAGWGAALLGLAVAGNVAVLSHSTTFSAFAERRITEFTPLPPGLRTEMMNAGRVGALGPSGLLLHHPFTFNYPTLWGCYGFAGYDQLISNSQLEVAIGANSSGFLNKPLTRELLNHLTFWSVRYLLVADNGAFAEAAGAFPQLRVIATQGRTKTYENLAAAPFAYFTGRPEPLAVQFRGNSVLVETKGERGRLHVSISALPGMRWRSAGGDWHEVPTPLPRQPVMEIADATGEVEVNYRVISFAWTVPICLLALVSCGVLLWRSRLIKSPAERT